MTTEFWERQPRAPIEGGTLPIYHLFVMAAPMAGYTWEGIAAEIAGTDQFGGLVQHMLETQTCNPILLRDSPWTVLDGHHRALAARLLGWRDIPADKLGVMSAT